MMMQVMLMKDYFNGNDKDQFIGKVFNKED